GSLRIRTVTVTEVVSYFPRWVIRITHGRSYDETVQVTRRRMHVLDLPHRDATPLRVWAGSSAARPNGARNAPLTLHRPSTAPREEQPGGQGTDPHRSQPRTRVLLVR